MRTAKICLLLGVMAWVLTAAGVQAEVAVDWDHSHDFSAYETYALRHGTPARNSLAQKRIDAAIESELAEKGFERVEAGADMLVVTHVAARAGRRVDVDSFGYAGYGWRGWGGAWGSTTVNVRTVAVGTLLVDILDGDSKELVWRGLASETLGDPKKAEKRVNKAVTKLLKKFPPE